MMIYVQQDSGLGSWLSYIQPDRGLGTWLSRAVSNTIKFTQQIDPVSHALKEAGATKTTIGKILSPGAINVDKPKTVLVVNAENCAKKENSSNAKCVEFLQSQAIATQSQQIIDQPVVETLSTSNKSTWIIGGALAGTLLLIVLANTGKKKKLDGVPVKKAKRKIGKKKKIKTLTL